MSDALLVLADHGDLVSTLPFVLPAFLIVGTLVAMRLLDKRSDNPDD